MSVAAPIELILTLLAGWARDRDDLRAIALVGSQARNAARAGSDVDLILLARTPSAYFENADWLSAIDWRSAGLTYTRFEDARYGACLSRHIHFDSGLELEFGFVDLSWANCAPIDAGTRLVISGGCLAVYDPDHRIAGLVAALAR